MDTTDGDDELRALIIRAATLAGDVPERFQSAAFSFICGRLVGTEQQGVPLRRTNRIRTTPSARRAPAARPGLGPKAAVTELAEAGFLAEPRTLEAISDHIRDKRGHTFNSAKLGTALLRMLRAGDVSREKGEDGEYRYRIA